MTIFVGRIEISRTMRTLLSDMRNQLTASSRSFGKESETLVSTTTVGHPPGVKSWGRRDLGTKQSSACLLFPEPELYVVVLA